MVEGNATGSCQIVSQDANLGSHFADRGQTFHEGTEAHRKTVDGATAYASAARGVATGLRGAIEGSIGAFHQGAACVAPVRATSLCAEVVKVGDLTRGGHLVEGTEIVGPAQLSQTVEIPVGGLDHARIGELAFGPGESMQDSQLAGASDLEDGAVIRGTADAGRPVEVPVGALDQRSTNRMLTVIADRSVYAETV